jgi:transcriptional regulator with XRE-family HTH domain
MVQGVPLVRVDPHRMRLARERLALTQLELAKQAGLGYATVSQLERGLVRPRMPTLRKLAKALGVKPAELLEDTSRS